MLASLRSAAPAAALLALLAAAACGGDDDDGGSAVDAGADPIDAAAPAADAAPDVGPSVDELGLPLAGALCPLLFECCSTGDLDEVFEDEDEPPADAAACVIVLTPVLGGELSDVAAAVAAGRMSYDPARMAACLEAIPDGSCGDLRSMFDDLLTYPGCQAPFAPLVDVGDPCGSNGECRSGFCTDRVNEELGTCAELPGEGDECELECAEGFTCDDIGSICIPRRAAGETCEDDQQCLSESCLEGTCGQSPVCDGEG